VAGDVSPAYGGVDQRDMEHGIQTQGTGHGACAWMHGGMGAWFMHCAGMEAWGHVGMEYAWVWGMGAYYKHALLVAL
jgi:hypothetical protein